MDKAALLEAAIDDALEDYAPDSINPERMMAEEIVSLRRQLKTMTFCYESINHTGVVDE